MERQRHNGADPGAEPAQERETSRVRPESCGDAPAPPAEFHRMRPRQIADARRGMPVAYVAFGILEWHGLHNPYGLDGLKADGIARRLANELGGIAMPPQYWGDNRAEICERHLDGEFPPDPLQASPYAKRPEGAPPAPPWNPADAMCEALAVPRTAFAANAARETARGDGWRLWKELAAHMFHQIECYGFAAIVAVPGHYPLFKPLREAIDAYIAEGGRCKVLMLEDNLFSADGRGDHAAAYETSLLMALEPETVDLAALDPDPLAPLAGVALGEDPRTRASRGYGEQALAGALTYVRERLEELLRDANNPQ